MKKKGMFMSLELLVVSLVLISVIVLTSFIVLKLKKTASVMSIINESRGYLEAVVNFKTSIGYWPGNVPSNILSQDNRFRKSIILGEQSTAQGTCQDALGTNAEVSPAYFDSSANVISGANNLNKTSLVFRQLAKAGFIRKDDADFTVQGFGLCTDKRFTAAIMSSAYYKNGIFPRSNYNPSLIWWFEVVTSDPYRARLGLTKETYASVTSNIIGEAAEKTSRMIPIAFNAYKEYWSKFYANAPLLMLLQPLKPISVTGAGTLTWQGSNCNGSTCSVFGTTQQQSYTYCPSLCPFGIGEKTISITCSCKPGGSDDTTVTAPSSWLAKGIGMGGVSPDLARPIVQKISNGMPFRYSGSGAGRVTAAHGNWQYGNNCFKKADGSSLGGTDPASLTTSGYTLDDLNNAVYNIKSNTKEASDSCIMIFAGSPSAI